LRLRKIAFPEFPNSLFIGFEPDHQLLIEIAIASINNGEYVDRVCFSFYLRASDCAEIEFVAYQLGRACSNQNIDAVNSGKSLQARGEIHRVANDRGIKS